MQGTDPGHPLGDRVHVQEVCGISHVGLPNADEVLTPYKAFLLSGRTPRRTEGHCDDEGAEINVFDLHVDLPSGSAVKRRNAAAPVAPVTLAEAFQAGRIDLLDLPDRTTVVSNARDPVALTFSGQGLVFTYTPIAGDRTGTALRYGPVTGTIVIAPGGSAAAGPVVTVDGVEVQPTAAGEPPNTPPPPPPAPPTTPPPGSAAPVRRVPAGLEVRRSAVKRHRLDVLARMTTLADGGRVRADFAVGRHHLRVTGTVRKGRVRIKHKLGGKLRRARAGIVTLTFPGSATVRPAVTRLLAAGRPARLKVKRLHLHAGKLRASGTIARRARGSVRLVLEWADGAGKVHTWQRSARIRRGAWKLSAKPPAAGRDLTLRYAGNRKAGIAGAQDVRRLVAE
jgi:hypothetical protein